jgi:hypothetical protein
VGVHRAAAVAAAEAEAERGAVPVPERHRTVPSILSAVSGTGMLFVVWGVFWFDPWPTVFGMALVSCRKRWFLDRMVWLWEDIRDATEEFKG